MATAITEDQEAVLRSFVGDLESIGDLQDRYDRLDDFDKVVLETLKSQLAVIVSDETAFFVVDGLTINKIENVRALERAIKNFSNSGGTGLETPPTTGVIVTKMVRPELR